MQLSQEEWTKRQNYKIYNELQKLIARYDWAVEGFGAPVDQTDLSVESAIAIRTSLVELAHKVEL